MADVYVEVGTVKGVSNNHLAASQAAMRAAVVAAVKKPGSGLTTVKPASGKGILVNVIVTKLAQDGTNTTCMLIGELFELRALLEPRLLKASAPRLTEADYTRLNEILQEYASELQAMHIGRWGELNNEFHMVLYQHARQPRSLAIVANLLQESDRHTRLQLSLTQGMERAASEHAEILKLCTEGKISAACSLLKTHIEGAGESLRNYLEEHQKANAKA